MQTRLLTGLIVLLLATGAFAGDSPRFRGPNGDGRFDETGLLQTWPAGGPPIAWTADGLGEGYASASASDGKIYVPGADSAQMGHIHVLGIDGGKLADIPYGPETTDEQAPGSRSTPTIDGDRLYILSGLGVVYCVDLAKQAILWQVNIMERFEAENNQWNFAESLLVDEDRVLCTPGGKAAGIAALNKMTGETVWATQGIDDIASYCSPAIITHNGRRILVTETSNYVVGVNPDDGALLWKHEHKTMYEIHAVTPLYQNGLLYFTGGYRSGGGALEIAPDGASVSLKWTDKNLDCQHHGVVLVDGYLYGVSHMAKGPAGQLICLEMATGKMMWNNREITQGVTVYADGRLYIYEGPASGRLCLVKASPEGAEIAGAVQVEAGSGKHWAHPTIANGLLLVRHGDALIAYDVRQR